MKTFHFSMLHIYLYSLASKSCINKVLPTNKNFKFTKSNQVFAFKTLIFFLVQEVRAVFQTFFFVY